MISISHLAGDILSVLPPELYLCAAAILLILVLSIPILVLVYRQHDFSQKSFLTYAFLVMLTIIFYRLPFLRLYEVNPDESQEISAALTLISDPVYFRSVDMQTHGPLSTYPLMLPHMFGIRIDYGSARMIGLAMLLLSVFFIFSMFRRYADTVLALIAVLPLVTFVCITDYFDFIAYNAEHPVTLVIVLALVFMDKAFLFENRVSALYLYIAGVIVGSAPFVKIQSLPLAGALALCTYGLIWLRKYSLKSRLILLGIYLSGFVTFTLILIIYLTYFGLFHDFVIRYLIGQFNYGNSKMSTIDKFSILIETFNWVNISSWYYFGFLIATVMVLTSLLLVVRAAKWLPSRLNMVLQRPVASEEMRHLFIYLLLTIMSIVAIYIPGRNFRHYYLLLAFPLGILAGKLFIVTYTILSKQRLKTACAVLFVTIAAFGQFFYKYCLSSYNVMLQLNPITYDLLTVNSNFFNKAVFRDRDEIINSKIVKYSSPGEKMIIWGWANKYYIGSNLIIGSRTMINQFFTDTFGNRPYYFNSFMHEIEAANAPVFLDAVAPGQFTFTNKSRFGFEQFPLLNKFIHNRYTCMEDIDGIRIFVSKQRVSEIQRHSFVTSNKLAFP